MSIVGAIGALRSIQVPAVGAHSYPAFQKIDFCRMAGGGEMGLPRPGGDTSHLVGWQWWPLANYCLIQVLRPPSPFASRRAQLWWNSSSRAPVESCCRLVPW